MKLSINLKGGASLVNKLKGNYSILLWAFLGLIVLLTGLVVFKEVRKISMVRTDTSGILDKIVRVNLAQHKAIETRLGDNSSFEPQHVPGSDAFGIAPVNNKAR